MPALLFMIGLVGLFFVLMAALLLVGLAREHYVHPSAEVYLAQLQSSADLHERPAIIADLRRQAFNPSITEKAFPAVGMPHPVSPADAARSASYLNLATPRVRPHDLFSEYLDVVFLFDAQGHLISWTYVTNTAGL